MNKTVIRIAQMDCPSEEQMIRMKLDGHEGIRQLQFDLGSRNLTIFHEGPPGPLFDAVHSLQLGASLISSEETADLNIPASAVNADRTLLWQVLGINFFFFILELITGYLAGSMGLLADSLDMLADSMIYALALYAAAGSHIRKRNIARLAGYFQLALAILGFAEVIRRFAGMEGYPGFQSMMIISALALAGNGLCLYLLQKSRSTEAHMRASMIFTSNDVLANLGVIAAGILVYFTRSSYPDLIIGTLVFAMVARGAWQIFRISRQV